MIRAETNFKNRKSFYISCIDVIMLHLIKLSIFILYKYVLLFIVFLNRALHRHFYIPDTINVFTNLLSIYTYNFLSFIHLDKRRYSYKHRFFTQKNFLKRFFHKLQHLMQFGEAVCLMFSLSRSKMRRLFRINIENNFDSRYALIKQDYNFYHYVSMIPHRACEGIAYVANDIKFEFFLRSRDM